MITMGDIIEDCTTESACHFLGQPGYDGIDDTDIETLTVFVSECLKRITEKLSEYKRAGRQINPTFGVSDFRHIANDPRGSAIIGAKGEGKTQHPSTGGALQEVSHQRWEACGSGSNVITVNFRLDTNSSDR